jgi:hypothetical protein
VVLDLQRITTDYIETEDRIQIVGELAGNDTVVIWLTRRLLDRLIPHLTHWLERQQGDVLRKDLLLSFAQQAAQTGLTPQAPVPARASSQQWLTNSIDLHHGEEHLQLVFKGESGQAASIGFAPTPLRQWLGIVQLAYRIGQWPQHSWPPWMAENEAAQGAGQAVVLH